MRYPVKFVVRYFETGALDPDMDQSCTWLSRIDFSTGCNLNMNMINRIVKRLEGKDDETLSQLRKRD